MTFDNIQADQLAFIGENGSAVGSVRGVSKTSLTIYVENAGDFVVPMRAVVAAHDGKVILDRSMLERPFLAAVGHGHDREIPDGGA